MVSRATAVIAKNRLARLVGVGQETQSPEQLLAPLRNRFWDGQSIPMHRALRRLTPRQSDFLSIVAIPLMTTIILWMFREDLSLFMLGAMFFFLDPLIDTLRFAAHELPGLGAVISVPRVQTAAPNASQWWTGFAISGLCLVGAALPMRSLVALRCFAGFFGAIQLLAQMYFATGQGAMAVNTQDYLVDSMQLSLYWIWFTPWLLGLTFNLFPVSQIHKLRVTALTVCHQLALFPVQFAVQAIVLHEGSGLWAATLFFAIGLPFNVFTTICFYGMGLAWSLIEREDQSRLKNS